MISNQSSPALALVDSHCHLNHTDYAGDVEAAYQRAKGVGVAFFLNVGYDLESSKASLRLAETYPEIYAAIGLHPHDARHWTHDLLAELWKMADHPKVVAIGETGLDYFRNLSTQQEQEQAFRAQIRLAKEKDLPVVVHDRDAHRDVLKILKEERVNRGVMHCFSGDWELAQEVLALGFYVSIAGIITFKNAGALQEVAIRTPLENLLVETDAPYLAPIPYRGKRNEPAYVLEIAKKVAELRGMDLEGFSQKVYNNALALFTRR